MYRREFVLGSLALGGSIGIAASCAHRAGGASRVSPQVQRRARNLRGEVVDLRDYCTANGRGTDSQSFQELLDLQPAEIRYPADAVLVLDRAIRLRSDQTHRFANGAKIDADVDGYALSGIGETGQTLGRLVRPVARYSRSITLDGDPAANVGDFILSADVSDPANIRIDANQIASIAGRTITTAYPIGLQFSNTEAFRVYHVYKPLANLRLLGSVAVTNHHKSGGFLRIVNARGVAVAGLTVRNTGYLGILFECSLDGRFKSIVVQGAGASGLGFRASKQITLDGFMADNVRADESLTFYDNVAHVDARNIAIRQYLFRNRKPGQSAGCDILIDKLCSDISLDTVTCVGAATYNVMIHNQSDRCSIDNFMLRDSNLGGIRISNGCSGTQIGKGLIAGVTDLVDQEAHKPVSAISVGTDCTDTSIGDNVRFDSIASGIRVASIPPGTS